MVRIRWFQNAWRVAGVVRVGNAYTQSATQTFIEDEVLVLLGGVDPNDLYAGYSPSGLHAGGRRSMITSLICGWIFRE